MSQATPRGDSASEDALRCGQWLSAHPDENHCSREALTDELLRRIRRCRTAREEQQLRQQLVVANLGVARALAHRYSRRGIDVADLEQVACEALTKVAARFDVREENFLAFAVPTITGSIKRHFRDFGWMVRPPRRLVDLQPKVKALSEELAQHLGRSPTPAEVADELGCDEEQVIEVLAIAGAFAPTSLDRPARPHDTASLGEFIVDDDAALERADARMMLSPLVQGLCARDRLVIELRFFRGWTQEQIGREIGVTQMQVSRLLARILADLRAALESPGQLTQTA